MAKPNSIELPDCKPIRILYEDRTVIAVDKPPGWMLVPHIWQHTSRNLQAAITSSIAAGDCPIASDELYGRQTGKLEFGLRAGRRICGYVDPFTKSRVEINAPAKYFLRDFGFASPAKCLSRERLLPQGEMAR